MPSTTPPPHLRAVPTQEQIADFAENVRDALHVEHALKDLKARADAGRRTIHIRTDEHRVTEEAIDCLREDPNLFVRGGHLSQVVRDESKLEGFIRPPGAPRVVQMHAAALRERLASCVLWMKHLRSAQQWVPAHPPDWAVAQIEARGSWPGIRPLENVIETPVIRNDGSIVSEEGYDERTGLLFSPTATFDAHLDVCDLAAAQKAAEDLLLVVCDFPLASAAHRSAWLAAVLTPLARYAFSGPAPMFLFDANTRGSGKSLLADAVGTIVSGRPMARFVKPDREEEWSKTITSIAIAGDALVLIDNVVGQLGGASIDTVLTGTEWSARLLGSNAMVRLPLLATWYATGNNVVLGGDTIRRTLLIRLESKHERPEERDGWRFPHLISHLQEHRPRLVRAALTILRAYCLAGRPEQNIPAWGSFDGWNRLVRHAIVWCGQEDPGTTRIQLTNSSDSEGRALKDLISGLAELKPGRAGMTSREIIQRLDDDAEVARTRGLPVGYRPLRDALGELTPIAAGKSFDARKVGYALRKFKGRFVGGRCLDHAPAAVSDGTVRWTVLPIEDAAPETAAPTAGDAGDAAPPRQINFPGAGDAGDPF